MSLEALSRTLWEADGRVCILDQTRLPQSAETLVLNSLAEAAHAIKAMQVRGAPLIGATAAYGLALALREGADDASLANGIRVLAATRPTAVNLHWALQRMNRRLAPLPANLRLDAAWQEARCIAAEDAAANEAIGRKGWAHIGAELQTAGLTGEPDRPLRWMTHCNAGWLATVAHGTALAPIYAAQAAGVAQQVWVSETRPRNQGWLTAWELADAGIAHTLIADNAAGLLLMQGQVDVVIVGADRIAANGDTANKVGTYLKALAARAHGVPFYVAAPVSTIDFACPDGKGIPIENRDRDELGARPIHPVLNPAFDVTPAHLIHGIITELGVFSPHQLCGIARGRAQPEHDGAH